MNPVAGCWIREEELIGTNLGAKFPVCKELVFISL